MSELVLSKRLPARTKTIVALWCKADFCVMDAEYRAIRAKHRKQFDTCFWCGHKIEDGEVIALACFVGHGNDVLCQPCAKELLLSVGEKKEVK